MAERVITFCNAVNLNCNNPHEKELVNAETHDSLLMVNARVPGNVHEAYFVQQQENSMDKESVRTIQEPEMEVVNSYEEMVERSGNNIRGLNNKSYDNERA